MMVGANGYSIATTATEFDSDSSDCGTTFAHTSDTTLFGKTMQTLKIGDNVNWRSAFGAGAPEIATIKSMELTAEPRDKYGESVQEVDVSMVEANRVIFDFTNGHWSYSEQVSVI